MRAKFQRLQFFVFFDRRVVIAHFSPYIQTVGRKQSEAEPAFEGKRGQPQADGKDEYQEEPTLISAQPSTVDFQTRVAAFQLVTVEQQYDADHGIRNGRKDQRPADGGTDADVFLGLIVAEHHCDEGDGGFRQGGTEGGEHRARGGRA